MIKKMMTQGMVIGTLILMLPHMGIVQKESVHVADAAYYSGSHTVTPLSSGLEWRYKTENGKRYMRLYDKSTGKWLTDWILCS